MDTYPEAEYGYEQPLHTSYSEIIFPNPDQPLKLLAKLAEYRERGVSELADVAIDEAAMDEATLATHGYLLVHAMAKYAAMQIVLEMARQGLGTLEQPITITDVATKFEQLTGVRVMDVVSGPKAIPFLLDEEKRWHAPAFDPSTGSLGGLDVAFLDAYAVVRAYAWDRPDVLGGGTGLEPVYVPESSPPEPGPPMPEDGTHWVPPKQTGA